MINNMWVGKGNLRMIRRWLVWTSEWIVTSSAKANIQKWQQVWECKIMSTALDKLSFRCLTDIKVMSTRQLDIWAIAQEGGVGCKRALEVINILSRLVKWKCKWKLQDSFYIQQSKNILEFVCVCVQMVHFSLRNGIPILKNFSVFKLIAVLLGSAVFDKW